MPSGDWGQGNLLAACAGGVVNIWAPLAPGGVPSLVHEAALPTPVRSIRWSPNRRAVAYGDDSGAFYTLANGQAFGTSMAPFQGGIQCLRFSHDCRRLLVASGRESHVLDVKRQAVDKTFRDHRQSLTSLAIDPKDALLATACLEGVVLLRYLPSPQQPPSVLIGAGGGPKTSLTFSTQTDGLLAAGAKGGAMLLRCGAALAPQAELLPIGEAGRAPTVTGVSFAGAHVLFGCCDDGGVLVWDVRKGGPPVIHTSLPSSPPTCVCVKGGDEMLAAAGTASGELLLLDVRAPRPVLPIGCFTSGEPVAELHWQPPPKAAVPAAAATAAHAAAAQRRPSAASDASAVSASATDAGHPVRDQGSVVSLSAEGFATKAAAPPAKATVNASANPPLLAAAATRIGLSKPGQASAAHTPVSTTAPLAAPSAAPAAATAAATPPLHTAAPVSRATGGGAGMPSLPSTAASVAAAVEHAVGSVRDDVRNLHVELLRQFHVQQAETKSMVHSLSARQQRLQDSVDALTRQVAALTQQRAGAALF